MKKVIEYGIYLLVFFLPWQTRWIFEVGKINGGASEYLTHSLYGVDLLLVGLFFLALFHFHKSFFLEANPPLGGLASKKSFTSIYPFMEVKLLLIFLVLGAVSIFWAENKTLALFREGQLILAVGFFWLIANFTKISKLAFSFLFSLIIPTSLGLWQFFAQTTFGNKWLGLAEHKANLGGTSVIETFSNGIVDGRWLRAYGSFDHPNILGATLAVGLLVALALLLKLKKVAKPDYLKLFLLASLVLFSAGLFVSFSRSAWLGLACGIIFMGSALFFQKKFTDFKNLFLGSVIIGVVFSMLFLGYQNLVNIRVAGGTRLENLSLDQREIYWKQAKNMIFEKPLLGVGIGNYVPALLKSDSINQAWAYQPVHNVFLLIWAELGIFGLLTFLSLLIILFWKYGRKHELAGALLFALLPMLLLDHWLWSFHYGLLFFALVISLVVGFSEKKRYNYK
jgi:O-antigen ligase